MKFPSRSSVYTPVEMDELTRAVRSDSIARETENSINRLLKTTKYKIPEPSRTSRFINDEAEMGVCCLMSSGAGIDPVMVLSAKFPEYLRAQDTDREDAICFAAIYARALDAVERGLGRHRQFHPSNQDFTRLKRTATKEYWTGGIQMMDISIAHRAAGSVATDLGFDFDTADPPSYPSHIAGLMDPLPIRRSSNSTATFLDLLPRLVE
jgi:hypothetical protein